MNLKMIVLKFSGNRMLFTIFLQVVDFVLCSSSNDQKSKKKNNFYTQIEDYMTKNNAAPHCFLELKINKGDVSGTGQPPHGLMQKKNTNQIFAFPQTFYYETLFFFVLMIFIV